MSCKYAPKEWLGWNVQITGPYNSQADGKGTTNTAACNSPQYSLYLYKIHYDQPYPHQIKQNNSNITIGFAKLKDITFETFP